MSGKSLSIAPFLSSQIMHTQRVVALTLQNRYVTVTFLWMSMFVSMKILFVIISLAL